MDDSLPTSPCPECGSTKGIAHILFGLITPTPELQERIDSGEVVLGGCSKLPGGPYYHCNNCGTKWSRAGVVRRFRLGIKNALIDYAWNQILRLSGDAFSSKGQPMWHRDASQMRHGTFRFHAEDNLAETITKAEVPRSKGVYVIFGVRGGSLEAVYIGKSGTFENGSGFKEQGLNRRLQMKQGEFYRKELFPRKIKEEGWDCLEILWIETVNEEHDVLPGAVEGALLQEFYRKNKQLPLWNTSY